MKTVSKIIGSGLCVLGWLLVAPVTWSAVLPYSDTFSVPPYVNDTAIAGQQGWISDAGGGSPGAVITNDFTGSGRGTSLYVGNAVGVVNDVAQTVAAPFNTQTAYDLRVKFDIYGDLASSTFAMPAVQIGDGGVTGRLAVLLSGMGPGAGVVANKFRLNSDSALVVPGISSFEDTWYTVTIDLSFASKLYNVEITDGVSTGILNNVPFWYDSSLSLPVPALNQVEFRPAFAGSYPNESGLIDNLTITLVIPEPSTALLLGIGTLVLWGRRRQMT